MTRAAHQRNPASLIEHELSLDDRIVRARSSQPRAGGDGRTFVLLHGLGMSHRSLIRLHRQLARTSRVLSFDLPGFGRLGRPRGNLSVPEMASGLGYALGIVGASDVVVIGQSMGSQWAVELASQRPDLVSRVVLIGPVVDDRHRTLRAQLLALGADMLREPPSANALVSFDYALCGVPWFAVQVRSMLHYRVHEAITRVRCPVLIVRGARDPIASTAWCRRLRSAAVDASLVIIPSGSHHAQFTSPRAVSAAIDAWLESSLPGQESGARHPRSRPTPA